MHCILLNAPLGDGSWRMHRSVEILGYHHSEREVRILIALLIENLLSEGTDNFLRILHRGSVECLLVPAWPLPFHPDEANSASEKDSGRPSILGQLYQRAFHWNGETLYQRKALTAWDGWCQVPGRPVIALKAWPGSEAEGGDQRGEPENPLDAEGYVPFTTWKLGPLRQAGTHLITLRLRIRGTSYEELVNFDGGFTVDGPDCLLSRIKYEDLSSLPDDERRIWTSRLQPFMECQLLPGDGEDIIILGPPLADRVEVLSKIGIAEAPLQPTRARGAAANRFVTANRYFSMALRYAANLVPSQLGLLRSEELRHG